MLNGCRVTLCVLAALLIAVFCAPAQTALAHDIPSDVTVQMFIKPSGQQLQVLVRVPLKAMRDFEFPERAQGYLDLDRADADLREAATRWLADDIQVFEDNTQLPAPEIGAARVSLESDRSFESYDVAYAHVTGPGLPRDTNVYWDQTMLDVLFDYPIRPDQLRSDQFQPTESRFSIHPQLERLGLRVLLVVRFLPQPGIVRAFEFLGDPGLVRLDPHWYQAASRFVELGFLHILTGTDHLLFLFCLVIPFRRFAALIPIVTAFTVAHSITLIASAYNVAPNALWFPPLIETLIATSIVYMALENIVGGASVQRRWMIAFGFGLVHGFGFSFALRQTLQFAGTHMLASLLSFNIGVELGQLLVLGLMIPALELFFHYAVAERMGTIILSAIVAHTAWHWMLDRAGVLRQYRFQWPALTAAFWASLADWLLLLVVLASGFWLISLIPKYIARRRLPREDNAFQP